MSYPTVMTEDKTIDAALAGASLARYGDGELRIALGGNSASQRYEKGLGHELRRILKGDSSALPCIPNAIGSPKFEKTWHTYTRQKFLDLYQPGIKYGSSFVTRPDSAPWIDCDAYWAKVKRLWSGKHCVLVIGSERSLTSSMMLGTNACDGALTVRTVHTPYRDAYGVLDTIEASTISGLRPGTQNPIVLCCGAAATVLAARLAVRGYHALDLGHIGMFMRRRERNGAALVEYVETNEITGKI